MPVSTTSTRNVMCSDAISLFLWFSGGETTTTTYEFANMCVCVLLLLARKMFTMGDGVFQKRLQCKCRLFFLFTGETRGE